MASVPVAGAAHSPDGVSELGGTVSSIEGTINVRTKSCRRTGIARSGGGVMGPTVTQQATLSEGFDSVKPPIQPFGQNLF